MLNKCPSSCINCIKIRLATSFQVWQISLHWLRNRQIPVKKLLNPGSILRIKIASLKVFLRQMNIPFPNKAFFIGDGISEKELQWSEFWKTSSFWRKFIRVPLCWYIIRSLGAPDNRCVKLVIFATQLIVIIQKYFTLISLKQYCKISS